MRDLPPPSCQNSASGLRLHDVQFRRFETQPECPVELHMAWRRDNQNPALEAMRQLCAESDDRVIDRRTVVAGMIGAPALARSGRAHGDPVAQTRYGRVRGLTEGGVLVFRGIRYGARYRRKAVFESSPSPTAARCA